ncbi:uncharacterized protein TNCV_791131 [Trichonephila clavipes]|nr:uncharacterized protein TNCV_791131 [Trichonephila clavipes]
MFLVASYPCETPKACNGGYESLLNLKFKLETLHTFPLPETSFQFPHSPPYHPIRRAEVDISLRHFRKQYEQLSQFERGRIIGMMETWWSARRVARQLGRSDCVVRRCWDQ